MKYYFSTLSPLTLLTLSALTTALLPISQPSSCSSTLFIHIRGTYEPPNTFFATFPLLTTLTASLTNTSIHETTYPATSDPSQESTLIGVQDISQTIQSGLRDCPEQTYALIGYSQGATVAARYLQSISLDTPEARALAAVLLLGNPYHIPGAPGNVDEDGGSRTADASGILLLTSGIRVPEPWTASGKVLDVCYTGDSICNGVNVEELQLLGLNLGELDLGELLMEGKVQLGDLVSSSHRWYGGSTRVQEMGAGFVREKVL